MFQKGDLVSYKGDAYHVIRDCQGMVTQVTDQYVMVNFYEVDLIYYPCYASELELVRRKDEIIRH